VEPKDAVNSPDHYQSGGIETIDLIEAKLSPEEFEGYLLGNCLKYLTRYRLKGKPKEDLGKTEWYIKRLISTIDKHS
jgi:hypothetical protein